MQSITTALTLLFLFCSGTITAQKSLNFNTSLISARQEISNKFRAAKIAQADISSFYQDMTKSDPELSFTIDGQELNFVLSENSLLAKEYFVTFVDNGQLKILRDFSVKTFDGVLKDRSGNITVTIDNDFLVAMMIVDGETYFIEQATSFDRNATEDELILYNSKDVLQDSEHTCAVDDINNSDVNPDINLEERQVNLCRLVDFAIASDASMFTKYGSLAAVTNHNISVMNNVAFNYRHEFLENIEFQIVTQFVSTAFANDPLSPNSGSTTPSVVLPEFRTWGNAGGFGVTYDEAQFWTNRDFDGSTVGLAYVGEICSNNRYHILQDFSGSASDLRVLAAHEMGHNWGANHDASGAPFIMAPSVNGSNDWSAASKSGVNAEFPSYNCLSACTGPVSALFTSTPSALCLSGTVQYKDKSVNSQTRAWTFTGGSPSTSIVQQPTVSYSAVGIYPASIVADGSSTYSIANAIIVSSQPPLVTASCPLPTGTPGSLGVQGVSLADMQNSSGTASADGSRYVDRTCSSIAELQPNTNYNIGIGLGNCNAGPVFESVRLYIDYNNNGVFDVPAETELSPGGGFCGFNTFNFTTSASPVMNQLLRMRIISNLFTIGITGPCYNPSDGQVEDFSVIFKTTVPLPLDLISFSGKNSNGTNILSWVTKNEVNMKRFTVERSSNGEDFESIGYVSSNNNQYGSTYTFKDNNISISGNWYYRLKMEDQSGSYSLSKVIFLSQSGDKLVIERLVTTNSADRPVSFQLISSRSQPVDIALFDMMGKLQSIYKTNIGEGQNNMEFTTSGIPAGMYILSIRSESGEDIVRKIIIE